jgi:hypothetical protein
MLGEEHAGSLPGAPLTGPTVLDHVRRFNDPNGSAGASAGQINNWLSDLVLRYRSIGRPPAFMPSVRPLLGYSFNCIGRSLHAEILSYPKEVFGKSRAGFVGLLSTLLAYFPELTLALEMSHAVGLAADSSGSFTMAPKQVATIPEDWAGLFAFLEDVRQPVSESFLHLSPAHFFNDGSRTILEQIGSLSLLRFFEREKGMVAAGLTPEIRADLGVGLFLRTDFLTDEPTCLEQAAEAFSSLGHNQTGKSRIAVVRYPRLDLPWFTPQSFADLGNLRAEPSIANLHRWFSSAIVNDEQRAGAPGDLIHLTQRIARDVSTLSQRYKVNRSGSVSLSVVAVTAEFPNPLLTLPIDCIPVASWLAGSGVHHFSHWFQRRSPKTDTGIMVLLVCLEIL